MVRRAGFGVAVVLAAVAAGAVGARGAEPARVGAVVSVTGTVQVGLDGAWQPATEKLPLYEGQTIRTGEAARAEILFDDAMPAQLGEKTEIKVEDLLLKAQLEKARARIAEPTDIKQAEIQVTPLTGVRGTEKTEEKAGDLKREHFWNENVPAAK